MSDAFKFIEDLPVSERRIHSRQSVLFSRVELGANNGGIVLNISRGGLALQAVRELIDDVPKMRFQLWRSQTWIEARGRLAWRSHSKRTVGVEFVDLSDEARKQIQTWISLASEAGTFGEETTPPGNSGQDSEAIAATELISASPLPKARIVDLFLDNQSHLPPAAENATNGVGWARRVAGLSLAGAILLPALFSLGYYLKKMGNRSREGVKTEGTNVPAPSSQSSAMLSPSPKPALDIPAFVLQVGAMVHEGNAKALVESLRQKNFPAFVSKRGTDRFYRVVVGPYNGVDSTAAAKNELENQGFEAIRTRWKSNPASSVEIVVRERTPKSAR
jgi:hypothetical protein